MVPTTEQSRELLSPQKQEREATFPWTLSDSELKMARRVAQVTTGKRQAMCRWCGEPIPAGRRLFFAIKNTKGWVVRQGALHAEPCNRSAELLQYLQDEEFAAAITQMQYEELRAAQPELFMPHDVTEEHPLFVYSAPKQKR